MKTKKITITIKQNKEGKYFIITQYPSNITFHELINSIGVSRSKVSEDFIKYCEFLGINQTDKENQKIDMLCIHNILEKKEIQQNQQPEIIDNFKK
jgi:hypothetical protein